jgi:hypothetical protein
VGPVTTVWRATTAGARLAALSLRLVASVSSAEHQTRASTTCASWVEAPTPACARAKRELGALPLGDLVAQSCSPALADIIGARRAADGGDDLLGVASLH